MVDSNPRFEPFGREFDSFPVGKIAEKAVGGSVFLTTVF